MTGTPAPENRSKKEQRKLVALDNRGAEAVEESPTMSSPKLFLKNSSTPTNSSTELTSTPWGAFSRQPHFMGSPDIGSFKGRDSVSASPRPTPSEIKPYLEAPSVVDENQFEHTHEVTVRIFSYGNPTNTLMSCLRELGRHLNHGFKDNFEMEWNGNRIEYDAMAHDGEHIGHDETLKIIPLES